MPWTYILGLILGRILGLVSRGLYWGAYIRDFMVFCNRYNLPQMTLPSMEREGQQEKQERKDDDRAAQSSKGEYARSDKEANASFETELVHSALCIQLFCIDEKYEMRFDFPSPFQRELMFLRYVWSTMNHYQQAICHLLL